MNSWGWAHQGSQPDAWFSAGVRRQPSARARSEVIEQLLHVGDGGYGPLDLNAKRSEILCLLEELFVHVCLVQASTKTSFWLTKGGPSYPVFWDFDFDSKMVEKG